jgi:hypothetical protein
MRHKRVRWILLAAATASGMTIIAHPAAGATTRHQMVLRFQPVTVLDPLESFAPTTVGSFVTDSNLETQTSANVWRLVTSTPSTTNLPTAPTPGCVAGALVPCYRLNQRDCTPAAGLASVGCYVAGWLSPQPRSVVYGRARQFGHSIVLQYWYFFYDDFYSYDYPPDDFIWQTHEGDWEAITVVLPAGSSRPRWVGYSQHCTGERRAWGDVPRWHGSTHPVADVAIGSHANEFSTGDHPIAVQCIPPQAVQFLQQQGLALPGDHSHPGIAFGPPEAVGVKPTSLVAVTRGSPEWMRFIGTWGEYQYFHGPAPINTVPSGFSPLSPAFTNLWQHPVHTVLGWPQTH